MYFPQPGHPMLAELMAAITPFEDSPIQASGTGLLNRIGQTHGDVLIETRVLPFDAGGRWMGVEPWAVHLWDSSSGNI